MANEEIKKEDIVKKKGEIIFYCEKYPNLTITVVPSGLRDDSGNIMPFKRAIFGLDPRYKGTFRTSDPEVIDKIRKSEFYKSGIIKEIPDLKIAGVKEHIKVKK